jgi:hypothetical protein
VVLPGASRRRIARRLSVAYSDGLLSEDTFVMRIERLLGQSLVDPASLVGDIRVRARHGWRARWDRIRTSIRVWATTKRGGSELLLALDWSGACGELLIGRHHSCDVVLPSPRVSRRHARLVFRDGTWVIQDLESTNGTVVNGAAVIRCALRPGDRLVLGGEPLRVD